MHQTNASTTRRLPGTRVILALVALALALPSGPALAGKKKEKEVDPSVGGLYHPPPPVTKPLLTLDSSRPNLTMNKTDATFGGAASPSAQLSDAPPPPLIRVRPIDSMRIPSLFD